MHDIDIIALVKKLSEMTSGKDLDWSNMKLLWKTIEHHEVIEGINANFDSVLSHRLQNALVFDPNYAYYTTFNGGYMAVIRIKDIINITTKHREFADIKLALEPVAPRYLLLIQAHELSKVLVIEDNQDHLEYLYETVMAAHKSQDKRFLQDSYDYAEAILNR